VAPRRINTDEQFNREKRRQELLDQRWHRWRSMILTATVPVAVLAGAIPVDKAVAALLGAMGVR